MWTLLKPPCLNRLTPEPMAAFQTGGLYGLFLAQLWNTLIDVLHHGIEYGPIGPENK